MESDRQHRPQEISSESKASEALLVRRVSGGLWILLISVLLYAAIETYLLPDVIARVYSLRALLAGLCMIGLGLLKFRPRRQYATVVAVLTMTAVCLATAASGHISGDRITPAMLSVVASTVSASLLPWGVVAHASVVLLSGLAALWSLFGAEQSLAAVYAYPAGAVLAVWVGSFYVLRESDRHRRALAHEAAERRKAEDETRRHQAALAHAARLHTMGEMTAELAHELNQPLAAIVSWARGCVRRMQDDTHASPEIKQALEEITTQAVRASEIIRRLRSFLRKSPVKREAIDLNELVREAVRFAHFQEDGYEEGVQLDLARGELMIEADRIQIEQVLINLVRNGIQAMQENSRTNDSIVIETRRATDGVEVLVRDRGKGFSPELAEQIFEPFFTTRPEGFGMGLSISRSIIEAHGGRLSGANQPEGGACFRFTIPEPTRSTDGA